MGNLKTERAFPEDRLSVMPSRPRIGRAQIIDATKGPNDYIADQVNLRLTLGREAFYDIIDKAEHYASVEEERRETEHQLSTAHAKELYDAQHDPFSNFVRAYLSKDPTALPEYCNQEKPENLFRILTELENNQRRYNSIFHGNVYHAIQTLRHEISVHAYESRNSLLTKIKEKLGK